MASVSTYSFTDITAVISHPSYPAFTISGQGIGEISISYLNDNTRHDLAADGSVMVSKVKADNCQITISMLQTSSLHSWLKGYFNFINNAPSSFWALASITIASISNGFDNVNLVSVAPVKRPDQPYQQQGQMVTWTFLSAGAQTIGSVISAASNISNTI